MKITIAGNVYGGLSYAMRLSQNHKVIALDIIPLNIKQLNSKISATVDVDIQDYLANKNLNFTSL